MLTLWIGLRSARQVARVMTPVLCSVATTAAALAVFGVRLNLFHLVSLLLVLGIGVNYALFFNREIDDPEERRRNRLALVVCNLTTVCSFGVLAFADNPVLRSIGLTVSLGAFLSLLYAWMRTASIPPR
jgi:predicted exporter